MNPITILQQRLLRVPLFYKLLLANSGIVVIGAVIGTIITVWHVQTYPETIHADLIAIFAGAGILISFLVNNWVLKAALRPLDRLQDAVDDVRRGVTEVRVDPGITSDDRFDRLAETFNQMLAQLEESAKRLHELPRQILQAQEAERHRLARDLHDEAAQALTSLLVHLRLLERAHTPEEAQARVKDLRELTAQALEEVRRVALDLRPTILDDLGLGPALAWRVDEFNKLDGVQATLTIQGLEERLPREIALVLYRVAQECLNNVARHAQAQTAIVKLVCQDGQVILTVIDDGKGFNPDATTTVDGHGFGLMGMRERLGIVGGVLEIQSTPGQGTKIIACVMITHGSVSSCQNTQELLTHPASGTGAKTGLSS